MPARSPRFPSHRAAIAAAALLVCGGAAAQRVSIEVITPVGSGNSFANAISDSGYVVGYRSPSGTAYGYLRRPDGSIVALEGGALSTRPVAVNEAGTAVGNRYDGVTFGGAVWGTNGALQSTTAGLDYAGINAAGQLAGTNTSTGSAITQVPGLAPVTLPTLGAGFSSATAINNSGWAVGESASRAALWRPGVAALNLGLFAGGSFSAATAVNNLGQVVGYGDSSTSFYSSFIWDSSSGLRNLGSLPGGDITAATGMNDAGQVVGQWGAFGVYNPNGFIWTADRGIVDITQIVGPAFFVREANDINNHAQIAVNGSGTLTGGTYRGGILTLHPDWKGGSGRWEDGNRWDWGGTGVAAARVDHMHDVVINPGVAVTVTGALSGRARSLEIGGNPSALTTFDLAGGTTTVSQQTTVQAGGVLRGRGTLAADATGGWLVVNAGGRVQVDAGQRMQIATYDWSHAGLARVQGTAGALAQLEVSGYTYLAPGARLQLTYGDALFNNFAYNAGEISLQDSSIAFGGALYQDSAGRLLVSFGRSSVDGFIDSKGLVVVSNGAEATFYGAVNNNGELRISAGGAANFFGLVSGSGAITGGGEARFEGGLSLGSSPGLVTVNPNVTIGFASAVLMELGGTTPGFGDDHHDKIVFNGDVTLQGGPLNVVWWNGFQGLAGDEFDLFDWNGGLVGSFGAVNLPVLSAGLAWDTGDLYQGGSISITAVPEPGTWGMLFAGLSALGFVVRRRAARLSR